MSRLSQIKSDASHSAVSASLIVDRRSAFAVGLFRRNCDLGKRPNRMLAIPAGLADIRRNAGTSQATYSKARPDEPALKRHQRYALGPTSRDINHRDCLDERASHGCGRHRPTFDFAETMRRMVPVVERPDRRFTPHRRHGAGATARGFDQNSLRRLKWNDEDKAQILVGSICW